jgi:two-component system alkaline phosphatase synthesis response regulator PhoP
MFDFAWSKNKPNHGTILIVDDEPNIVQTLKDRLEMNDYRIVTACNGKEGLQKALAEKPDVILLDIIMPTMDGLEMLAHLRKTNKDIPVIMLTARSQDQDIERATACGIDDYIIKPFDLSELIGKIEGIFENRRIVSVV